MSSPDPVPPPASRDQARPPHGPRASTPAPRRAPDQLPPALSSMWRLCRLGFRYEPALMGVAFVLALVAALPDALLAVWFTLLGEGLLAAQARPAPVRGRRAGGLGRGDLAAGDRVDQAAAAFPGQGDDRPRVPRGTAAGRHLDDRAPGAAGVPGPAVRAARADLHPRPHVHVGLLHRRLARCGWRSPSRCWPP